MAEAKGAEEQPLTTMNAETLQKRFEEEYPECIGKTEDEAIDWLEAGEGEHFQEVHPDFRHRATAMSAVKEVVPSIPNRVYDTNQPKSMMQK